MITHRDFVVGILTACCTLGAVALAQPNAKPPMASSAFDWEQLKVEQKPYGQRRAVFDSPVATLERLEMHVTTINPGQRSHAPHRHVEEEMMIIKEGTVESEQNGETKRLGPGSIIFEASNELHGVRNVGDTPATYYVIKWYSPVR